MDVLTVEGWSKCAREVPATHSRQQSCGSPREVERGGKQQFEESRYEPGLTLVDSDSDPRAWLASASGTCAAHATSPDYLRHSPCPSTGSYHGEEQHQCVQLLSSFPVNYLKTGSCNRQQGLLVVTEVIYQALEVKYKQKERCLYVKYNVFCAVGKL